MTPPQERRLLWGQNSQSPGLPFVPPRPRAQIGWEQNNPEATSFVITSPFGSPVLPVHSGDDVPTSPTATADAVGKTDLMLATPVKHDKKGVKRGFANDEIETEISDAHHAQKEPRTQKASRILKRSLTIVSDPE